LSGDYDFTLTVISSGSTGGSGSNGTAASGEGGVSVDGESPAINTSEGNGNTISGEYWQYSETVVSITSNAEGENLSIAGDSLIVLPTTITREESGNTISGAYYVYQETTVIGMSGAFSYANGTESAVGTISGDSFVSVETTGNLTSGLFYTETYTLKSTTVIVTAGVDARGNYTSTTITDVESFTTHYGDSINGDYLIETNGTVDTYMEKAGDNGETTYDQELTVNAWSHVIDEGNPILGNYDIESESGSESTLWEYGYYLLTPFDITTVTVTMSEMEKSGDSVEGDYTITYAYDYTEIDIFAFGSDSGGSYIFDKFEYFENTWSGEGNSIDGSYEHTGVIVTGSTAHEENTYADGEAEFTEILWEAYVYNETGNTVEGDYDRLATYGERTSGLEAETIVTGVSVFSVTQSSEGTFTRTDVGNRINGEYDKSEEGEDEYSSEQTAMGDQNYTLTITGTNSYTDEDEGNTVTGDYIRTKNGTDEFEIDLSGTKTAGSYTQEVTGSETYTLVDNGNLGTGHYDRTIESEGTYARVSSGAGATMPTDSGAIDYFWEQAADPRSGMFDMIQTGVDRYDLLEDFYDISNMHAGRPGHMKSYSFGLPFVDPWINTGQKHPAVPVVSRRISFIPATPRARAHVRVTPNGAWAEYELTEPEHPLRPRFRYMLDPDCLRWHTRPFGQPPHGWCYEQVWVDPQVVPVPAPALQRSTSSSNNALEFLFRRPAFIFNPAGAAFWLYILGEPPRDQFGNLGPA